jgi:hypothetical protein
MDRITFSQAVEGYTLAAHARHLSSGTLADYNNTFRKLQRFLGDDRLIGEIGPEVIRGFLAAHGHLSKKTVLNSHTGLSVLWWWARDGGARGWECGERGGATAAVETGSGTLYRG